MLLVAVNGAVPAVVQRDDELDAWSCIASNLPLGLSPHQPQQHLRAATVSWFDGEHHAAGAPAFDPAACAVLRLHPGVAEWRWAAVIWGTAARATVALPPPLRAVHAVACRTLHDCIEVTFDVAPSAAAIAWVSSFLVARVRHTMTSGGAEIVALSFAVGAHHATSADTVAQEWAGTLHQPQMERRMWPSSAAPATPKPVPAAPLLPVPLVTEHHAPLHAQSGEGTGVAQATAPKAHKRGKRGGKHRNLQAKAARAAAAAASTDGGAQAEDGSDAASEGERDVASTIAAAPSPQTSPLWYPPGMLPPCHCHLASPAASVPTHHLASSPTGTPFLAQAALSPPPSFTDLSMAMAAFQSMSGVATPVGTTWHPAPYAALGPLPSPTAGIDLVAGCVAASNDPGAALPPSDAAAVTTTTTRNGPPPGHRKRISQLAVAFAAAAAGGSSSSSSNSPSPLHGQC